MPQAWIVRAGKDDAYEEASFTKDVVLAGWGRIAIPGPQGGFFTVYILGPLVGGAASALIFRWLLQPLMGVQRIVCSCQEKRIL